MPAGSTHNGRQPGLPVVPNKAWVKNVPQQRLYPVQSHYAITGITKDSTGVAVGGCTVKLYKTSSDAVVDTTLSDANGNYSFPIAMGGNETFYVVSYKAGSPDIAGTTVNTLVGV